MWRWCIKWLWFNDVRRVPWYRDSGSDLENYFYVGSLSENGNSSLHFWVLTRLQFRHGFFSELLLLSHLKWAPYMYLEGTLISIRWPSPDALTAAAGWSSTEHLPLISWWVRASDVTDGPTTSRPTPMVVKKSFAFRVAVLATSIAAYDQLLFARAVCRFCIFIYNLSSSSWTRR